MENYNLFDILGPWLILAILVYGIGLAEDWIHRHSYGLNFALLENEESATRLFYVFFLPGILIYEGVQYLMAGFLNVPIKKITAWPEAQKDGTLRLDFIVILREEIDPIRAAIVALSPLPFMGALVWILSTEFLDLHDFTASIGTGDAGLIWAEWVELFQTPNYLIWFYLLFVIANTMVPNQVDAHGWPLFLTAGGVILAALLLLGLSGLIIETLLGPVNDTLGQINTALLSILVLDVLAIAALWGIEGLLAWWTGKRMDYESGRRVIVSPQKAARQAGSDEPLPLGSPLPSIYTFNLPLPDPDDKKSKGAR
jgi:hypothetical protein